MRRRSGPGLSAISIALCAALLVPLSLTFLAPRQRLVDSDIGLIAMMVGIFVAPTLAAMGTFIAMLAARRGETEAARFAWIAAAIALITAIACFAAARAMRGQWA